VSTLNFIQATILSNFTKLRLLILYVNNSNFMKINYFKGLYFFSDMLYNQGAVGAIIT